MSYRPLEHTFYNSPKIKKLARRLNLDIRVAHGTVSELWSWALSHAPDGDLSKFDFEDIEDAVHWDGGAGALIEVLIECRLVDSIDAEGGRRVEIHNWLERGGTYAETQRKKIQRKRKRDLSRDVPECPGTSADIPSSPSIEEKRIEENIYIDSRTSDADAATEPAKSTSEMAVGDLFDCSKSGPTPNQANDELDGEPVTGNGGPEGEVGGEKPKATARAEVVNLPVKRKKGTPQQINEVWQHYRTYHPNCPERLYSTEPEYRQLRQRLAHFTVDQMKQSLDGFHADAWHNGTTNGTTYLNIETLTRTVTKIADGIDKLKKATNRPKAAEL